MNEQQVDLFGTLVSISCLVQFPPRLPFCQQTIVSDELPEAEADLICIEHIVQISSLQPMPHPHVLLFNTGKIDRTGVTMALILLQYVAPLESINPTVAELDGIAGSLLGRPSTSLNFSAFATMGGSVISRNSALQLSILKATYFKLGEPDFSRATSHEIHCIDKSPPEEGFDHAA